jgi:hypothetical protein
LDGPECTTSDGVAIIRVDYQTVPGAAGATGATLLGSEGPFGEPVLNIASTMLESTEDWTAIGMTINVHSDSTVTLVSATLGPVFPEIFCREPPITYETATSTDFAFEVEVCAGTDYELTVNVLDEVGFEYEVPLGLIEGVPSVAADSVDVTVNFIPDSFTPILFFSFFEFRVRLEDRGVTSTTFWDWVSPDWPSIRSIAPRPCSRMIGASANNAYDPRVQVVRGALKVYASYIGPVSDRGDCIAPIGLASEVAFVFLPLSDLQQGRPITVRSHFGSDETRPPGHVRLEVTVTGEWHLELDGVRL